MRDVTTSTGTTVPGDAIEQLLFTEDWLTGVRAVAYAAIRDRASQTYGSAYALTGGGELHPDAHDVATTNLLHSAAPGIVAFALHHLRPLLPDLSDEQWARIDAAAVALDSQVCEDLSGANGDEHAQAERQRLQETCELITHGGVQTALWGTAP